MIGRWFGPSNSLVLAVDPATMPRFELEEALDDVGRYYRFGTLSEAAKRRGVAAVVFPEARKRHFLHYTPLLRPRDIPVTVFVQPDCVGLTRLPLGEELAIYRARHPEFARGDGDLEARAWEDADWAERRIAEARAAFGPLPYDDLDPTRFFARWRDLQDFPPAQIEIGLDLPARPSAQHEARLATAVAFATTQVKRPLRWFTGRDAALDDDAVRRLAALGAEGYLGRAEGAVVRRTSPWAVPRWPLAPVEGATSP